MSSSGALQRRLSEFKSRFSQLLGAKAQGYGELSTLEQPLVGGEGGEDDYERQHGVGRTGYQPPTTTQAGATPQQGSFTTPAAAAAPVPSQTEELQELSVLARDAAELLWEMVALGESGAAVDDMRGKGEQLQAQLRGLIGDYSGGDEALFARAFESFDMLSRCLEEQKNPAVAPPAAPSQPAPSEVAPMAAAVAGSAPPPEARPPADEAPLISLD